MRAARDADGNEVTYEYTGLLLTRIDDASGQRTLLEYDGNNLSAIHVISDGVTQALTTTGLPVCAFTPPAFKCIVPTS